MQQKNLTKCLKAVIFNKKMSVCLIECSIKQKGLNGYEKAAFDGNDRRRFFCRSR